MSADASLNYLNGGHQVEKLVEATDFSVLKSGSTWDYVISHSRHLDHSDLITLIINANGTMQKRDKDLIEMWRLHDPERYLMHVEPGEDFENFDGTMMYSEHLDPSGILYMTVVRLEVG